MRTGGGERWARDVRGAGLIGGAPVTPPVPYLLLAIVVVVVATPPVPDAVTEYARARRRSLSVARPVPLRRRRHPLKIQLNLTDKSTGRDS